MKSEIGLVGLGVMGKSLSRNLGRNGFKLSIYNRHVENQEVDVAINCVQKYDELKGALPFDNIESFVQSLQTPRKIILMVNAGAAVDAVIENIKGYLEAGDIIIDGGNSHYSDTNLRINQLKAQNIHIIGTGISGGEEGALWGPSIMPSGEKSAYDIVGKYLETISAKDKKGAPCCAYIGSQGSGHFVKMIHNGIEYAEMQLIAECYAILKRQGASNASIASTFKSWLDTQRSYLLEITVDILNKKENDIYILDQILDKAGNKGTGKWATMSIADYGLDATMIPAALFARYISFFKESRVQYANIFNTSQTTENISNSDLLKAYEFSRIINHYQGFNIIKNTSDKFEWNVNLSEVARVWTAGCIIRSDFMELLVPILKTHTNILLHETLVSRIKDLHSAAQTVSVKSIKNEIHTPCILEAVNYFHGIKTKTLPANIIQAQRDYFGAHTYKKLNDPSGKSYHTNWL